MHIIRLALSVDHQKKKATSVGLPFFIYLHFVTSKAFESLLPDELALKCQKEKERFLRENQFFSDEYMGEYKRSPYIRFLTGPDVHKFFAKLLSLNYQTHRDLLNEKAGAFTEFFAELDLFWNDKYRNNQDGIDDRLLRDVLFCQACLQTQYQRLQERQALRDKLDDFAKAEIKARDQEITKLKKALKKAKADLKDSQEEVETLNLKMAKMEEERIVLVPGDPHHLLGLASGEEKAVEKRAKALLKALHPDRSGTSETAYLFDLILKSRDMILR